SRATVPSRASSRAESGRSTSMSTPNAVRVRRPQPRSNHPGEYGVSAMDERILLIGFGNMGRALVRGWLDRGVEPSRLRVVDPADGARAAAADLGLVAGGALAAASIADGPPAIVMLAVKPAQLDAAVRVCKASVGTAPLYLSIAAGKPIASIAEVLGPRAAVVRAMPNTPAAVGRGMTVLTASERVDARQRAAADELMRAVGM